MHALGFPRVAAISSDGHSILQVAIPDGPPMSGYKPDATVPRCAVPLNTQDVAAKRQRAAT